MRRRIGSGSLLVVGCVVLAACVRGPTDGSQVGVLEQALVTNCDYLDPGGLFTPIPLIDFDKELVIRDVSVVEDPCRTTNSPVGPCAPGTTGVWTFHALMRQMAGSTPVNQFVQEWLHTFEKPITVNTFGYAAPMPGFRNNFLDPWVVASGCVPGQPIVGPGACNLNLMKAPFRLLGIFNRIDLSGCVGRPPGPGYDSGPGQGRFVFGFLDSGTPAGNPLQATVILEYNNPSGTNAFGWAAAWHALSSLPLPSPTFNKVLQGITDAFTLAGLEPGNPNFGNAISTVRTNEISFGGIWQLREFTLQDIGFGINASRLLNDTTKMTPDDGLNSGGGTGDLDPWLVNNAPLIANMDHVVPLSFFPAPPPAGPGPLGPGNPPVGGGNACLGGASNEPQLWQHSSGGLGPMERHLFGFTTCNGCHTLETQTNFTHIDPRLAGFQSNLSSFLSVSNAGSGSGLPASSFSFFDPAGSGLLLDYNEPWRRTCEVARLLWGDPCPFTKQNGAH